MFSEDIILYIIVANVIENRCVLEIFSIGISVELYRYYRYTGFVSQCKVAFYRMHNETMKRPQNIEQIGLKCDTAP